MADPEGPGLGGLCKEIPDFPFLESGRELEDARAAGRGPRELSGELEDDVELEGESFDAVLPEAGR